MDTRKQMFGQHCLREFQGLGQDDFPLLVGHYFGVVYLALAVNDVAYVLEGKALGDGQGNFRGSSPPILECSSS